MSPPVADVAQPDQARIVALNAHHFLKNNGKVLISIKASCIDSTAPAEAVFAAEVKKMQAEGIKPHEQLTLGPSPCPPRPLPTLCCSEKLCSSRSGRFQSPTRGITRSWSDLIVSAFPPP